MESKARDSLPVPAQLSLWDAVSIIIGIVIGAGIYETPPRVFGNVPGPWEGIALWALGGILSLIGALCYAELASTYRRSGGDYVYLTRAFGPWMGFLFGWAQLVIIRSGNIGMMAYVFADYAMRLWDFGQGQPRLLSEAQVAFLYAVLAVTILTTLNILGVVFGKGTQNVLTAAKVLGLGGILAAGFLAPASESFSQPLGLSAWGPGTNFGLALVFVLYTYGGWNDAALVAAEQRNPRRNIPLALLLGTAAIMLIYVFVNTAYLRSLGFAGSTKSSAIAADTLERAFGQQNFLGQGASRVMSVLVMISALGAINGMIFTGSRVYSALGSEYSLFAWLGGWNRRLGSPLRSLVTQYLLTLVLICAVGTEAGHTAINQLLSGFGFEHLQWKGRSGFDTLLACTAPAFWLFFLLTGLSVFILREKDPHIDRPFTVALYPLLPLVFCDSCAYMLYSSLDYASFVAGKMALLVFVLLHLGLVFYWLSRRRPSAEGTLETPTATKVME